MVLTNIKEILINNNLTIATAESCTGGNIQALLTSIGGSSNYFSGGITAYNIDQKVNLLNVDRIVAEPVDCVSQEVCEQMVEGCSELFGTNISIATTGYITDYLHYAIMVEDKIIISDIINVNDELDRKSNQVAVSEKILSILLEVLRTEYSPYLMI